MLLHCCCAFGLYIFSLGLVLERENSEGERRKEGERAGCVEMCGEGVPRGIWTK